MVGGRPGPEWLTSQGEYDSLGEELFDVISGFEALATGTAPRSAE